MIALRWVPSKRIKYRLARRQVLVLSFSEVRYLANRLRMKHTTSSFNMKYRKSSGCIKGATKSSLTLRAGNQKTLFHISYAENTRISVWTSTFSLPHWGRRHRDPTNTSVETSLGGAGMEAGAASSVVDIPPSWAGQLNTGESKVEQQGADEE